MANCYGNLFILNYGITLNNHIVIDSQINYLSSSVTPAKINKPTKLLNILIYNLITSHDHLPKMNWTPPLLNPLVEELQHNVESSKERHKHIE